MQEPLSQSQLVAVVHSPLFKDFVRMMEMCKTQYQSLIAETEYKSIQNLIRCESEAEMVGRVLLLAEDVKSQVIQNHEQG